MKYFIETNSVPQYDYRGRAINYEQHYDLNRFYAGYLVFDDYDEKAISNILKHGETYLKDYKTTKYYDGRTILAPFYKLDNGSYMCILDGKCYSNEGLVKCENLVPIKNLVPAYYNGINKRISKEDLVDVFCYVFHGKDTLPISKEKYHIDKFYYGNLALASYTVDEYGYIKGQNGMYHLPFEKYSCEPIKSRVSSLLDIDDIYYSIYDAVFYGKHYCLNNGQDYKYCKRDTDPLRDKICFNMVPLKTMLDEYDVSYNELSSPGEVLKYYKKVDKRKNGK